MHSSRMRTARLLTVSGEEGVCIGGKVCPTFGGVCICGELPNPGGLHLGGLPNPAGVSRGSASRGVCPTWGALHPGGSAQPRGGYASGGLPTPGGSTSRGATQPRGLPNPWGVCIYGGLHLGGLLNPWGVCIWGSAQPRGVCLGGSASRGCLPNPQVCLQGGWEDLPPPVNRMTHRCKNITLPQTSFAGGKYEQ